MSTDSKALLAQTKFVMLSAISASGRNTIIEELLKTDQFYPVVSDTTRKKRINDGVEEESGKFELLQIIFNEIECPRVSAHL